MAAVKLWVINLDRRADRMETFLDAHKGIRWEKAERWSATDGRELQMDAALAKMLEPNDFFWKKSVAGCALSHIGLWRKLVDDPDADTYVVLEDDVRIRVADIDFSALPVGYDIVYLGGILPHNRPYIDSALANITDPFVQIGQGMHFCTYAYVLSKAGARKLLGILDARGGIYSSLDLIMCQNAGSGPGPGPGPGPGQLAVFTINPMIAGCSQDDNPIYQKADFNKVLRIDEFDSDIWTNIESWSEAEYGQYVRSVPAWAKKVGFQEINPVILHEIIREGHVPVIVGALPAELMAAVPVKECVRDEDAWELIRQLDADADLRGTYMRMLSNAIGMPTSFPMNN